MMPETPILDASHETTYRLRAEPNPDTKPHPEEGKIRQAHHPFSILQKQKGRGLRKRA